MILLLERLGQVSSTNDVLRDRAALGAPHGLAVWADSQTHGRGRNGRSWYSPPGASLYFSLLVRLRPPQLPDLLPLAAGVAAAETIEALCGLRVGLKWPNDLVVANQKLGGILCEGVVGDGAVAAAIVGIGINVALQAGDIPADLADIATSLTLLGAPAPALEALASALRVRTLARCEQALQHDTIDLLDAWRARDATAGRRVRLLADQREGVANGINDRGHLRVTLPDGEICVSSGEVHVLKPSELLHVAGH